MNYFCISSFKESVRNPGRPGGPKNNTGIPDADQMENKGQ